MSTGSSTEVTRRGFLPRLRDARIRVKLAAILVVPLVVVVALAGVRLVDVGQRASTADQVQRLTGLQLDISTLTQLMHTERMAGAAYLAVPGSPVDAYQAAIKQTEAQSAVYFAHRHALGELPASLLGRLNRIDDHLLSMAAMRSKVAARDGIRLADEVAQYGAVVSDLVAYGEAVSQFAGTGAVANALRAVAAFARAKAGASDQEAIAYAATAANDLGVDRRTAFIATQTQQAESLLTFSLAASPSQQAVVDKLVTGDAVNRADRIGDQFNRGVAVPLADLTQTFGAVVDGMRGTEQELETQLATQVREDRDAVIRQAATEAGLVLLGLILAVVFAVLLARSLNRSLRGLRESALSVANRDLPDAVARLRDAGNLNEGGVDDIVRQVRDPIRLTTRDEIGQVAQAFNVVHREAVRVAAEQAALRTSVSSMFLNLARRSQSLVDRMIGELDSIERTEEDPKRLARLFELDHLATRMRRNDENLLILAGADSSAPRRSEALLIDVLRAAQSEVELYNRIEFGAVDTDVVVVAGAVNDVVRLVAELLDNATRFSPPNTVVVAEARRIRDYVVIQVEDRGLGMSDDQMNVLNQRLVEPPTVDVAAFRMMGLAVVGRLAARYGIRVELRANMDGGTVARVVLPSPVVGPPSARTDALRAGPLPELTGSAEAWPAASASGALATLPALAAGPEPEPAGPMRSRSARSEPDRSAGPAAPRSEPARPAHPLLPAFPSQRPATVRPEREPSPARPSLPTRGARPAAAASTTEPLPTVGQRSAGFVPAMTSAPISPNPAGWGAALAATPAQPVTERAEAPIFVEMQHSWFTNPESGSLDDWGMPTAGHAPPPNAPAPNSAAPNSAAPSSAAPNFAAPTAPAPSRAVARASVSPPPAAPAPTAVTPPPAVPTVPPVGTRHGGTPPVGARHGGTPPVGTPPSRMPAASEPASGGAIPRPRQPVEDRWRTAADDGWQRAMAAADPIDAGTTRSGLPKRVPQAQLVPGGVHAGPGVRNRRTPDEVRGLLSAYHRGVQRGRTDGSAENAAQNGKENQP